MFNQLLPRRIDNTYRGYKLGLWLFAPLVFVKVAMGLNCIFNGYSVASSADGIPLDTYPSGAAQTIVSDFALWGLCQLMFGLLGILVLVRYRRMVPFMFGLLLLEHLSRKLILQFLPVVKTGTPPGFYVNLVLLAVMVVGLAVSLRSRENLQVQE
ncbi:MAG: hypothetical protein ACRD68_01605 [Pyrinomonadaceae bacterium]